MRCMVFNMALTAAFYTSSLFGADPQSPSKSKLPPIAVAETKIEPLIAKTKSKQDVPPSPARLPQVKADAKIDVLEIPPTPALTRVKVTTTPTVTSNDAIVVWFVFPPEKVFETERMDSNELSILVQTNQPATTYTYIWLVGERGKPQITKVGNFKIGKGPKPPDPDPDDPPIPDPDDPPTPDNVKLPFPTEGFYTLMLSQDTDFNKYTPSHRAGLAGELVWNYLNAKCPLAGVRNWPTYRHFDIDQQFATEDAYWKTSWERAIKDLKAWEAKNPGKKTPWILVGNGKKGFSGPMPEANIDATMTILKKYGGD